MTGSQRISRLWELTAVLLITLLAGALQFYRTQELPPGLHFDEGFKGVTLLRKDNATLAALQEMRPDGQLAWKLADGFGPSYAVAYHLPATTGDLSAFPAPDQRIDSTLGSKPRLVGYSLDAETSTPGNVANLILYWQALGPLEDDYTVFAHMLGNQNPPTFGLRWAGHDSQPGKGRYPTTHGRDGEAILDVHPLAVPANAPPGLYQLEASMYLLSAMLRLPGTNSEGQPKPDDAVPLGTIQVMD